MIVNPDVVDVLFSVGLIKTTLQIPKFLYSSLWQHGIEK